MTAAVDYSKHRSDQNSLALPSQNSQNQRRNNLNVARRVLVIEDDIDTGSAIKYIVESYSSVTTCKVVADPYEAILALSDQQFDIVLVDQKLPGLTGSSVLMQVDRFIDEDPLISDLGIYVNTVPAIMMSGSSVPSSTNLKLNHFHLKQYILKNELNEFLAKNFSN